MDGLLVVILCIMTLVTPPIFMFSLHHQLRTPHSRQITHLRIVIYGVLLYVFIGIVSTMGFGFGELDYVDGGCREPYECNNITTIAHVELWLRMALYPVSQNKCFMGNDYVCQFIDREVMGLWSHGNDFAEDKEIALLGYYIFAVIFAIPPLIMYSLLRRFYLKPTKQKPKNNELLT